MLHLGPEHGRVQLGQRVALREHRLALGAREIVARERDPGEDLVGLRRVQGEGAPRVALGLLRAIARHLDAGQGERDRPGEAGGVGERGLEDRAASSQRSSRLSDAAELVLHVEEARVRRQDLPERHDCLVILAGGRQAEGRLDVREDVDRSPWDPGAARRRRGAAAAAPEIPERPEPLDVLGHDLPRRLEALAASPRARGCMAARHGGRAPSEVRASRPGPARRS